ncbi:MAG: hypothetical protein Q7T74_00600 [Candidatus Saccharibacteria bacterium]|nr:hypothetical protein [Candidatus Saccharibacteria bacterium]
MRQFIRTYRFVKLVDEVANRLEEENPEGDMPLSGYSGWHPNTLVVKEKYRKKYPKIKQSVVHVICADTIKNDYLEGRTQTINSIVGTKIDTLCITSKGRKLMDKPIGTFQEFLGEYGLVVSFLTGSAFTGLVVFVWNIIST